MTSYKALVVGGGPAGLSAACLLAREGVSVALIGERALPDARTVALMQPTLRMLAYIGLWPGTLENISAPLKKQRIVDDTGSLFVGPDMTYDAREIGLDAFAWNIPLQPLTASLRAEAERAGVQMIEERVTDARTSSDSISVETASGKSFTSEIAIAADGYGSLMRARAGIGTHTWSYDQSALVTSFGHSGSHHNASCEYSKRHGPCTVVPLPGKRSAVVWMDLPEATNRRANLSDTELAAELQIATHGELGLISDLTRRASFPMRGLTADEFAQGRTVLVGEAAHVVPPIGAQGLNMSFRDAALAVDLILAENDAGSPRVIETYSKQRKAEVVPRQQLINAMNRSLLMEILPLDAVRVGALWTAFGLGPLRQQILRFGLGDTSSLPFAMRERPVAAALP